MRRLAALVALLAIAGLPGTARADDVSSAELRSLAREAANSPSARERLRQVDSVDGRPADLDAVLEGASDTEARRRLEEIAGTDGSDRVPSRAGGDVRGDAAEIVEGRRFRGTDVPRPFEGVLKWIGDRFESVIDWFERRLDQAPGPPWLAQVVLALLILGAAALFTARYARRRGLATGDGARGARRRAVREDPAQLEREADAAEAAGDFERAVRLRFRAGLLRLGERDVIAYRPSLTTSEVARRLESPAFDELGSTFDRVAYGGSPASADDAARQRAGWTAVLEEQDERERDRVDPRAVRR